MREKQICVLFVCVYIRSVAVDLISLRYLRHPHGDTRQELGEEVWAGKPNFEVIIFYRWYLKPWE